MLTFTELLLYCVAALAVMLTPGPNMLYCVSRALCQGRMAGWVSVLGVQAGNVVHIAAATLGLTALLAAMPMLYDAIRYAGAAYLLWLAWQAIKPGGRGLFEAQDLPHDSYAKLFRMGLITNLLNPKQIVFFTSIFSQFLHPERGSVLQQGLQLAATHISLSFVVNGLIVAGAAGIAVFFQRSPIWLRVQRYFMATVLTGLAVRLVISERK
ncbi:LysE family translocator [Variovorax sp. PCZ-1]|uniref:LysE family translocator n=1 Tax=Variovorax sp. PCZ-1 TaxID=2835533 RepID=UPI001BCEB172|nr:LysE family translocator [Variovorax sp. PCZ-1]MBS7806007.1 LysE family translocator [Variovorax sp. PCZ-1]